DCARGVLFDGYPRTVEQAKALDSFFHRHGRKLDAVINFEVDMEGLVARRAGRLYAPTSKRVYHETFNPPKVPGNADETGEPLIHRKDDQPDVGRHRLEAYAALTAPVLGYYRASHRVEAVDGMAAIEAVSKQLLKILETKSKTA